MRPETKTHNRMLYELAQTIAANGNPSAAAALRKTAQAGYTNLDEIESTPDWILLSTPGIGIGRLTALRGLTRTNWEPPSPRAAKAATRFLSAAQFALRFWPREVLVAVIRGGTPVSTNGHSYESRLAKDLFSQAARKALRYCDLNELAEMLCAASQGHHARTHHECDMLSQPNVHIQTPQMECRAAPNSSPSVESCEENAAYAENDHFAYPCQERLRIVRHYWAARENREIANKDQWARANYQISGRTLLSYEREFAVTRAEAY